MKNPSFFQDEVRCLTSFQKKRCLRSEAVAVLPSCSPAAVPQNPPMSDPHALVVSSAYCHYHKGMSARKVRLTVTVDGPLVQAGQRAVRAGRADSLSAWVNQALAERADVERRRVALAEALAAYEREFGEITEQEIAAQLRQDRKQAVIVRGRRSKRGEA